MIPTGKGMFIWQIPRLGSISGIVDKLKAGGFDHAMIKIADGDDPSNVKDGVDYAAQLATALKAAGIEPWGWQYVYLYAPSAEAAMAIKRMEQTGCVGFVMDVETQCKNKPEQTEYYCDAICDLPDSIPVGLSSYRFPSLHPEISWNIWRSICDFDMPQVYWVKDNNPAEQLEKSFLEYQRFTPKLPYIPTGAAYYEDGWKPTTEEVRDFMSICFYNGWRHNFWEMYDALVVAPELWPVIAAGDSYIPSSDTVMVTAFVLNIRSTPAYDPIGANVIGWTSKGKRWKISGRVKGADGREWVQVGPSAYLAGWLTVPV